MDEYIVLSNFTVDLSEVAEIYDQEDHVLIVFGGIHEPFDLKLTGNDAEIIRTWLDRAWATEIAEIEATNGEPIDPQSRKRLRHSRISNPPNIDEPPPF